MEKNDQKSESMESSERYNKYSILTVSPSLRASVIFGSNSESLSNSSIINNNSWKMGSKSCKGAPRLEIGTPRLPPQ